MAPQLQLQLCKKLQPWIIATEQCDHCQARKVLLHIRRMAACKHNSSPVAVTRYVRTLTFFLFQIIMHKTVWIKIFEIRSFTSDPLLQILVDPAEMPGKLFINPFRIGFPLHQRTLHESFYVLTKVLRVDTIRCKVLMPASPHCISPKLITDGSLWKLTNSCQRCLYFFFSPKGHSLLEKKAKSHMLHACYHSYKTYWN